MRTVRVRCLCQRVCCLCCFCGAPGTQLSAATCRPQQLPHPHCSHLMSLPPPSLIPRRPSAIQCLAALLPLRPPNDPLLSQLTARSNRLACTASHLISPTPPIHSSGALQLYNVSQPLPLRTLKPGMAQSHSIELLSAPGPGPGSRPGSGARLLVTSDDGAVSGQRGGR